MHHIFLPLPQSRSLQVDRQSEVIQSATTAEPKFPFQFQMYWLGM